VLNFESNPGDFYTTNCYTDYQNFIPNYEIWGNSSSYYNNNAYTKNHHNIKPASIFIPKNSINKKTQSLSINNEKTEILITLLLKIQLTAQVNAKLPALPKNSNINTNQNTTTNTTQNNDNNINTNQTKKQQPSFK